MKQFWPVAIILRSDGRHEKLFTYDSFLSFDKAREQFAIWASNGCHILKAWVDVQTHKGEGKIVIL